jgi:ubiquinol-cytochrome c reductase cytochrome b subunit
MKSFLTFIKSQGIFYGTPKNLSYFWNFGSLALFALIIQFLTGIFLTFWYIPDINEAFNSVEFIMREVRKGWLIRYLHANGASFFFLVVYCHVFKNLYTLSFTEERMWTWFSGLLILLAMMFTAFLGYVLPWGQMSFWAATVITSLVSVIPKIGNDLLIFIWGGYGISQPTLTRVYGLHYLMPFIILFLFGLHMIFLHNTGSNNPLGFFIKSADELSFFPYFVVKDLLGINICLFLLFFVFFNPNYVNHPDNYIPADPLKTPAHIVPEWYLLMFYGILRSVPNKLLGIIFLLSSLFLLFLLPLTIETKTTGTLFRPYYRRVFWFFVGTCLLLSWASGKSVEYPFFEICKITTFFYFFILGFLMPFIINFENRILLGNLKSRNPKYKAPRFKSKYFNYIIEKNNPFKRKFPAVYTPSIFKRQSIFVD